MKIDPDVFVSLRFYETNNGGRNIPTPFYFFSCIFVIDGSNFDVRLLLDEVGSINPGEEKSNVPVKFLCPELVMSKIKTGSKFYLRDGKVVAEGVIEKIANTGNVF